MIGPDDIAAFEEAQADNIKTADEFARRSRKVFPNGHPFPADRWADGETGLRKVADGITAYAAIVAMQAEALAELHGAMIGSGREAMELHAKRPE